MARVLISGISRLLTWESREKCHLGVVSMSNHRKYYKGEGGGFPQVWAMVSLVNPYMFKAPKVLQKCSNYILTNLLFGLCKSIWIIESLVTHLNPHPKVPTCPSYPRNVMSKGVDPNSLFHCFHFGIHIWVNERIWGCITLSSKTTFVRVNFKVNLFQSLDHHLDMLQMINPIHVMYVDIINKNFQELVVPMFKNLCHSSRKGVSSIF